jgi:hypothetical protein
MGRVGQGCQPIIEARWNKDCLEDDGSKEKNPFGVEDPRSHMK